MSYSLVVITKKHENNLVDGIWLQHCMGTTLEEAIERARDTEKINNTEENKKYKYGSEVFEVAVVEELSNSCPDYSVRFKLKRLDKGVEQK